MEMLDSERSKTDQKEIKINCAGCENIVTCLHALSVIDWMKLFQEESLVLICDDVCCENVF